MSLTINSCCSQPSFSSGKSLPKLKQFVENQASHAYMKIAPFALLETTSPSPDLKSALARLFILDLLENTGNYLSGVRITAKKQCTNLFSWATDGMRALDKLESKN